MSLGRLATNLSLIVVAVCFSSSAANSFDVSFWKKRSSAPCSGGAQIAGHCWFLSAAGTSCDTACAGHGGYNAATRTYAGDLGTLAHCTQVLNALGIAGVASNMADCASTYDVNMGCAYTPPYLYVCTTSPTTAAAEDSLFGASGGVSSNRACACGP